MNELLTMIPPSAWLGGVMIGLAAVALYALLGRIAGISGIFFASIARDAGAWRWLFIAGIPLGAWLASHLLAVPLEVTRANPGWPLLALAGLLVGWGTRMGNGCTSGHGVCGLGRLSPRSLAAVLAFMATGMLVATLMHFGRGA